ncbi:hypothetical protein Y1Q_0004484 [Alligator mississippiensis]|uniref:Uncharacterized protein n=1 Tax=Alligator mississippiensis TaxID=8496 RepID=A0A151NY40_ALLMI|nr:hypothetical protein Y1Q_0004484 [Alligator mississippiensis]
MPLKLYFEVLAVFKPGRHSSGKIRWAGSQPSRDLEPTPGVSTAALNNTEISAPAASAERPFLPPPPPMGWSRRGPSAWLPSTGTAKECGKGEK